MNLAFQSLEFVKITDAGISRLESFFFFEIYYQDAPLANLRSFSQFLGRQSGHA